MVIEILSASVVTDREHDLVIRPNVALNYGALTYDLSCSLTNVRTLVCQPSSVNAEP